MNRILPLSLLIACAASLAFGQSGRKSITPKPTPTPVPVVVLPTFSESTPKKPRRPVYTDRFPGVSISAEKPVLKTTVKPATETTEGSEDDIVRVETSLITIPVSVFDRNGLYIPGLAKENFKIFEDGKEQAIEYFGTSEKPFTVVLLIDTSPSTDYKIEEIQRAATRFVDNLKPQDKVIVIEFDDNIHVLTEATADRERIYKAISKADFGYGTSLYDAVDFSIKKRLNGIEGRKAIVLFTDGVDTTSRKANYDSSVDLAEESDVLIFPIYYNTFDGRKNSVRGVTIDPKGQSASAYSVGKEYLEELSGYTGGRVFTAESTAGGLTAAFEGIAEELRRQYNIGYVPSEEGTAGQRKQIKVRVDRPNLVLRSRDSYVVGAAAPSKPTKK